MEYGNKSCRIFTALEKFEAGFGGEQCTVYQANAGAI
jgi:hypothetical protein